jgi:hypothetical protein
MPALAKAHRPTWYAVPVRIALVTFLLTLISFALCLLLAILGSVLAAKVRGLPADLPYAYRHVALPIAAGVGAVVLLMTTVSEIRHYRQSSALAGIARSSRS